MGYIILHRDIRFSERKIQVGTAAMLAALRHPVMLAQSLATLDCLFPGRAVSGFGVGRAISGRNSRRWAFPSESELGDSARPLKSSNG
jgi:alkanesulfonate monooxygenase SsuD/methylene tetrahydromethanopterin reductase-like flavin-dependent oxidoreductase (luciferase family)